MPRTNDFPYLLRLLDDDAPIVRPAVSEQFSYYQGDLSHDLAALGISLSLSGNLELSQKAQCAITSPCYLGDVLLCYLKEMHYSLAAIGWFDDACLLKQLGASLKA